MHGLSFILATFAVYRQKERHVIIEQICILSLHPTYPINQLVYMIGRASSCRNSLHTWSGLTSKHGSDQYSKEHLDNYTNIFDDPLKLENFLTGQDEVTRLD